MIRIRFLLYFIFTPRSPSSFSSILVMLRDLAQDHYYHFRSEKKKKELGMALVHSTLRAWSEYDGRKWNTSQGNGRTAKIWASGICPSYNFIITFAYQVAAGRTGQDHSQFTELILQILKPLFHFSSASICKKKKCH